MLCNISIARQRLEKYINCTSNIYKLLPNVTENKMLPNFHESSSNYPLIIVVSMHSMLSLHPKNSLHEKKLKVKTNMSNEGKYVKTKG